MHIEIKEDFTKDIKIILELTFDRENKRYNISIYNHIAREAGNEYYYYVAF